MTHTTEQLEAMLTGARDAAYERAAEMIREYPHFMLMTPDQKKVCVHLAQVILALRDKPAPAVTVRKAILEVWGCCEELEDEALAKLSGVKTEHEKGFWTGQKMTAKRIRRATQMPIAGGGDE